MSNKNYINFDDKNDKNKNEEDLIETSNIGGIVDGTEEEFTEEEFTEEEFDIEDDNFNGEDDIEIDNYIEKLPTKEEKFDLLYHFNTNKHRQEGKHRLKRDTIFKGKLDKKPEGDICGFEQDDYGDLMLFFDYEAEDYSNNVEQCNLTKDVYEVLKEKTELDFRQNRRKPNKESFNKFYDLLLKELGFRYTKAEIFVELSYYFTDNIFNMFKLLDKRPATVILKELTQKGYLGDLDGINFL